MREELTNMVAIVNSVEKFERDYTKELAALKAAKAAADAEALRLWERDGKIDTGACGDAMLELDKRSKLFKAAMTVPEFRLSADNAFVCINLPEGIRSQNADIYQGSKRKFKDKLIELGYGNAIKRWWTYID